MINWPAALVGCAIFAGMGWLLTQPEELRANRWRRILLSLPFVILFSNTLAGNLRAARSFLAVFVLFLGVMAAFAIAFIWRSVLAHYGAGAAGRLIYGDMNVRTGVRSDFRAAKSFYSHGELREAFQEVRAELKHDPLNYEGLLLLADLHLQSGFPAKALLELDRLLQNPRLTPAQHQFVTARRRTIEEPLLVQTANRR